jgi:surface polysaccharide O-acyltransferase-like enzyme
MASIMSTSAQPPSGASASPADNNSTYQGPSRNLGLDLLRVVATYMVVQIHTGEFYYIGAGGSVLDTPAAHCVGWLNSLFRSCVPLFVMISGAFLFPVRNEGAFFRKRFSRVLVPFVVWCVIYAFYLYWQGTATLQEALLDILKIPVNFGTDVGHLWFVYMLLGIYLIAPVLSPWVESASRRSMECFLALWAISLTIPYIHLVFPQIWGEAFWNSTPMLYYFSGYVGYAIAGAYIKRFRMQPSRSLSLAAVVLILAGYAITASGFLHRLSTEKSLPKVELTWGFETINVAMITVGLFLLFRNIQPAVTDSAFWKLIRNISRRSYGMYLAHIIVLNAVYGLLNGRLDNPIIKIPAIAIVAFLGTYALICLIALLPKSEWIVG